MIPDLLAPRPIQSETWLVHEQVCEPRPNPPVRMNFLGLSLGNKVKTQKVHTNLWVEDIVHKLARGTSHLGLRSLWGFLRGFRGSDAYRLCVPFFELLQKGHFVRNARLFIILFAIFGGFVRHFG